MATTAIEPLLEKGSKGDAVKQLQSALKDLGYDPGGIDGIFGSETESAVKHFQSEPLLKKGATGLPVRRLQKRSTLAGYDMGGVDGTFGAKTKSGVKAIQGDNHLTVDGVVGPKTWAVVAASGD